MAVKDKPSVTIFDPESNPGGFTLSDVDFTTSPLRTQQAVVDLLNLVADDHRYLIEKSDFTGVRGVATDLTWRSESYRVLHRSEDGSPGGAVIRIIVSQDWPVEIFDTGRRMSTKLSTVRAEKKVRSGGWRY